MRMVLRASILGGLTLGLLVLAAVGSRQERWGGGGGEGSLREVPPSLVDSAYTLLALAVVAAGAALVLRFRPSLPNFRPRERSHWIAAVFLFLFAFFVAILLVRAGVVYRLPERFGVGANGNPANTGLEPQTPDQSAHDPRFQWWLAAVSAAAGLAFFLWRRRRTRPRPNGSEELRAELEAVLGETLEDLESERDPRRAVIRAYARMERVLAAHGLPREPSEAPLEYLARLLRDLRVRAVAAHALTELFERAKFSQHEIDLTMKAEAIAALASVRDDLKVAA